MGVRKRLETQWVCRLEIYDCSSLSKGRPVNHASTLEIVLSRAHRWVAQTYNASPYFFLSAQLMANNPECTEAE